MWLLAVTLENGLFLAGMALVILVLLRRTAKFVAKAPRDHRHLAVQPRPDQQPVKDFDAPPEILQYQVQLHDTARELTARLDSKMVALLHLVREADRRIDRLEALTAQLAAVGTKIPVEPAALQRPVVASEPRGTSAAAPGAHQNIFSLADQGFSAATIAHRVHVPLIEVEAILHTRSKV